MKITHDNFPVSEVTTSNWVVVVKQLFKIVGN